MNAGKVLRSLTLRRRRSAGHRAGDASPALGIRRGESFEHVVTVTAPADVARTTWRRLFPHAPDDSRAPLTEAPDGSLAWRSVRANRPQTAGTISFEPMSHGRGTVIRLRYAGRRPGKLGKALQRVTPGSRWRALRHAVYQVKHVVETGEIPTTRNQPTGEGRNQ